jgi:hypothetical protein
MQIMVCGGIYSRADELGEEIMADLTAHNARDALRLAEENPTRVPREHQLEPGRRRKRQRKSFTARVEKLREELGVGDDE